MVNFSSACITQRFPSSRCVSAIQIVRPLESVYRLLLTTCGAGPPRWIRPVANLLASSAGPATSCMISIRMSIRSDPLHAADIAKSMRPMSLSPLRGASSGGNPISARKRQGDRRLLSVFRHLKNVTLFCWQRIASTFRPFQGETKKSQYASTNKINSSEASRQFFHEIHIHNFTGLCAVHIGESAPNRFSYAAVIPARFRIRLANIVSSGSICHVRR